MGMNEQTRQRFGVIAQELAEIHPKSVNKNGEFLTVNENRMFYDNIATVQELSTMHEALEEKIEGRLSHMQAFFGKIFSRKRQEDGVSVISEDEGKTDRSSLTASYYSLASAFKREIAMQSKEDARINHACSRLTQGTIITLVVVMAICLLSMSALYIFDWHHRNY
ncbi:hypothetical protein PMAYCL1PPCAC_31245, partial [Pristionchus mayeri]